MELWTACFTVMQCIWILSWVTSNKKGKRKNSDKTDTVQNASTVDPAWILSDNESFGIFHKNMSSVPKFRER